MIHHRSGWLYIAAAAGNQLQRLQLIWGGAVVGQEEQKRGANKRIFKKRADWRGKKQNVFTTIQSKAGSQSNKKKEAEAKDLLRKCWETLSSRVVGGPTHKKKKEKGKTLHSFQSGKLLLCSLYYGGRNSRHKSCCRPRQKTCLNYKVTRKNNPKEMTPPGSFSLSLPMLHI